jgi:preprotein translocase subunit SecA
MIEEELEQIVSFHTNSEGQESWDMKEIIESVATIFPLSDEQKAEIMKKGEHGEGKLSAVESRTALIEHLSTLAEVKYEELLIKKAPHPEVMIEVEKQILLRSIDNLWVEHLVAIDYLRTGIGLRGYAQRDPLVEYKKETYRMFNELLSSIQKEVVYLIYKISVGLQIAPSVMAKENNLNFAGASKTTDGSEVQSIMGGKEKDSDGNVVGRNDQCPCGSGKKYKKCHGA